MTGASRILLLAPARSYRAADFMRAATRAATADDVEKALTTASCQLRAVID